MSVWIWGWHSVEYILKARSRKVQKILVLQKHLKHVKNLLEKYQCNYDEIIEIANEQQFIRICTKAHQGIAFLVDQINFYDLVSWINKQKEHSTLIACDQILDGHNLGAIIRTAVAFGASGVLVTKMHTAPFEGSLAKSAAGALELMPIIKVSNLVTALKVLKKNGYMIFGLDERGETEFQPYKRNVLVFGQEGAGLRELTKKNCDATIALETNSEFPTLNVSVACAIAIYKFLKQSERKK